MLIRRTGVVCLVLALSLGAAGPSAKSLYREGRKAERAGDVVRAYLLYSQAAAMDPQQRQYWTRAQALRTQAALKAKPHPVITKEDRRATEPPPQPPKGLEMTISEDEIAELARLREPPELKPKPGRHSFELRGDFKAVFDKVAKACGLDTVYDSDYEAGRPIHLHLDDTGCLAALHALEAATGSFVVPLGEKLFLVAKDTPQKRIEVEPTVAVSIPIPDPVTPQEAQEMARAVQQTMDIQKFAVDPDRHMVVMKDRISKVRPAQLLFEQLAHGKPQLELELEFLELNESTALSYGFLMPTQFPITWIGTSHTAAGQLRSLAQLVLGTNVLGIGIANASLFATMTSTSGRNLIQLQLRASDGQAATFHVGQRYPVLTGGFLGGGLLGVPPSFNFEDLGLTLKVTPHVHGIEGISLEVNAEFKVLAGQSINGIPVIANRSLESKVRLRDGEWAVVAGLMTTSEARTISGPLGLMQLPLLGTLFRDNQRNRDNNQVLLLLKPRLLTLPPGEYLTRELYIGSEGRLNIPL